MEKQQLLKRDPWLYAHRGASIEYPENTIEAFEQANRYEVNALELDVHVTQDGHPVVIHDPIAVRTTGIYQKIAQHPLKTVETWNVGFSFVDAAGNRPYLQKKLTIPRLETILSRFKHLHISIEIKPRLSSSALAILKTISAAKAQNRVTLASFHHAILQNIRQLGYQGRMALSKQEVKRLLFSSVRFLKAYPLAGQEAQLPLSVYGISLVKQSIIAKCHQLGLSVVFWTVNDPNVAETLLTLGADGIMTDNPAIMRPVFARYRAQTAKK